MSSNLVSEHPSLSSITGTNLVIAAQMVFNRSRCRDGDGDGVRGLFHKRLRRLRWARALKIVQTNVFSNAKTMRLLFRSWLIDALFGFRIRVKHEKVFSHVAVDTPTVNGAAQCQ